MQKQNSTMFILLLNLFIAFLGIGLVIPVTPKIMNELHLSGAAVGYMVSAFALTQLIVSPISGHWADSFGRKKMILIGLLIFSASEFLFGIGKTSQVLFLSRMLGGAGAAFIMPAITAFISDITTLKTRPKAMGYMSAAISTGFIIGPGIGGFLGDISTRLPFFFAAGLGAVAAVLTMIALKEPERNPENEGGEVGQGKKLKRIFSPLYFTAFLIIFISSFGLASFESLFSLFVDHKFGFTPKDIAIIITGGAIAGAIVQLSLFGRLTAWLGEIRLIRYSMIFSTALVVLLTFVNSYVAILLVTVTVFIGFDIMRPALTMYLSKIAGKEQGFVGGMNSMFTSIGNVFGPAIGGILFDIDLNYPFYFATAFLTAGIGLTYVWKKKEHTYSTN